LGRELGKTLEQLGEMTVEEVYIWMAYFQIETEETKKQQMQSKQRIR